MSEPLGLSVDRDSDVPLGTQLGWKLATLIRTGRLTPGTRLPGVRELAEQAGVHVNTVRGVYSRLEEEGLISSEHGRGTFVAERAPQRAELARVLAEAAAEASSAGLDPRELAAALFVAGDLTATPPPKAEPPAASRRPGSGPAGEAERKGADAPKRRRADATEQPRERAASPGERARRRRLREEIAELEQDLVYLEPLGPAGAQRRLPAGRILTAAELEEVRDALAGRLDELRAARAEARRRALQPPEPEPAPAASPRVWRHAGVWTGGAPARVRTVG
jgi:DNA-binding transcriptional regulator YhcF (GntR family)